MKERLRRPFLGAKLLSSLLVEGSVAQIKRSGHKVLHDEQVLLSSGRDRSADHWLFSANATHLALFFYISRRIVTRC